MITKRLRVLLTGSLMTCSILFTGCGSGKKVIEYPVTLEQVLTEVNEQNQSVSENYKIDDTSDYYFDVNMDGFTENELEKLFTVGYMTGVKPEKAKEDINLLFTILEGSYAGYAYFGGAQAFDQARADMITEIETYGSKNLSTSEFTNLIRNHLDFVIDNHLLIGGIPLGFDEAYCWYDKNIYEYHRDSNGYYTIFDEVRWYLPENEANYLHYTIGKSGELVYGLFFIGTESDSEQLPTQVILTNKKKEKNINIQWKKSVQQSKPSEEYKLVDTDGIKTARIAAFSVTQNTNAMINDAKELSKEDYAIIDLRYNTGGLTPDVTMWMYNYSNKELFPNGVSIAYNSIVNDYWHGIMKAKVIEAFSTFDFVKENPEIVKHMINNESPSFTVTEVEEGIKRIDYKSQWTQRDGKVLFLLNGKDNVSCGEYFIEVSKTLENTLIVGTNSGGCLTTGDINSINTLYLPNSNIGINYTTQLMLFDRPNDFDRYGILPDIYIGAGEEAEAVARCIRYYQ